MSPPVSAFHYVTSTQPNTIPSPGLLTILKIWGRFVRFETEDGRNLCGEPLDKDVDGEIQLCQIRARLLS